MLVQLKPAGAYLASVERNAASDSFLRARLFGPMSRGARRRAGSPRVGG